jgi:hypothetical protein
MKLDVELCAWIETPELPHHLVDLVSLCRCRCWCGRLRGLLADRGRGEGKEQNDCSHKSDGLAMLEH